MTTAHDFIPGPTFQFPSLTFLEYDVHKTTKKAHAMKEDALQIEKGLSKLDTPEYTATITPQVKEMKEKATNLIVKSDSLIGDMEIMRQQIENEREETEQLKITLEKLKLKCENLALEIEDMKDKMKKLEESKNIIHLAQVTWLFERYTAMFVLPPTEKVGWLGGYKQMKKYINAKTKNKKEREKRLESKERWLKLQNINQVQWSEPDHFGAIEDLREVRKPDAHPPVDFLKAKEDIENITPQNTEECLDIIRMVETLNSVLLLGCLACKLQELTATEWENLTSEVEWSPDHDKALLEMKTLKGNAEQEDLQKVDLEEAKKHLNGYVPDELLRQCFDIVDILNMPVQ